MKDIGIGNHVMSLMKKCQNIASLESPTNLKKLSKVAKMKGVDRFGRNSSMILFNMKNNIMTGEATLNATQNSVYDDSFEDENPIIHTEGD